MTISIRNALTGYREPERKQKNKFNVINMHGICNNLHEEQKPKPKPEAQAKAAVELLLSE